MKSSNIGMMVRNVPFSPSDITQIEIGGVVETLTSGWTTAGPKTKEPECLVAEKPGTDRVVCLNSNTVCTEMTLRILGTGSGDEVIAPAYTCTASVSIVSHVGAKIALADYKKDRFTIDYEELEVVVSLRTKAITLINTFGTPVSYNRILETIDREKYLFDLSGDKIQWAIGRVIIMPDGVHCSGAARKGRPAAQYPDFINYLWHTVKNLTTAGGGVVTWRSIPDIDNSDLYHQYMLLSLHGQSKDTSAKTEFGVWECDIVGPWYKCNMTDVHAAIGPGQVK